MDRPLLVFTDNFDRANKEIESKGGRVVHRLGRGILVVNLPKPTKISNLDTCDSKMPAWLDDEEKLIVKAWKATAASKGTELLSLMTRSTREGVKWSESGFQAPGSDDPGRRPRGEARSPVSRAARSTGIATSLYMTGSVAVGIIIVSGDSWHKIPGGLKCVSAASDGTVWGVNKNDDIYRRVGNSWQKVSGGLKQISVGSASQIWGVNKNDDIYRRVGNSWQKVSGGLKHVSVASDGTVWGVNKNDDIYRRVGNSWQKVSGGLKQISVGSASQIWGVNKNDNIYRRVGNSWQKVSGGLKHVSVASDGTVWGVNKNDDIYRRVGNSWQQVSGGLKQISVGSASQIWGVNNADNIYERKILATA